MIEFALGIITCLLLVSYKDGVIHIGKKKKTEQPSEKEVRDAERIAREYTNFMTYDGTEQDGVQ